VLKHKALVMVSILVLVLAVVAMSCAPAKPPAPPPAPPVVTPPVVTPPVVTPPVVAPPVVPAVEIKTSFEAATYTNENPGFSIKYPKEWTSQKAALTGSVFFGKGDSGIVYVAVRPATSFKDAAIAFLGDYIVSLGVNINPDVESEKTVTLADGKTQGNEIILSAMFGARKGCAYGVIKDGKAIMVLAGVDPKNLNLYKEICETLVLK
jgi:hypothetical protein